MTQSDATWTIVTGSTGGLGQEIVRALAAKGKSLILVNRSPTKAEAQRQGLLSAHRELRVALVTADLMDLAQIDAAVAEIAALPGRIDTLYNNSGLLTDQLVLSAQGFESQFAVNTLAPFQLTKGLQARMARAKDLSPAMVVNLSSSAINAPKALDLSALPTPSHVGGIMKTYAQTKLAVTALSAAMAQELKADNILIRAIDPGATKTAMTLSGNSAMPKPLQWLAPFVFSPADKQAAKLVDSADPAAFSGATGVFIANRTLKKLPKSIANEKTQQNLLALLRDLTGKPTTG